MKSNLKLIFVLCITIILVFVLILFTNNEEKINFYLMGDGQMTIRLGAEYYEMGFVATDKKGKSKNNSKMVHRKKKFQKIF